MRTYAGRCRLFIYLQSGQPPWLRLIKLHAGRVAGHLAVVSGRCGETAELEGREPIINTPPHLLGHPKVICDKERF